MPFTNLKINGFPVWMPESAAQLLTPPPPSLAAGAVAGAVAGAAAPAVAQAQAQAPAVAQAQVQAPAVAPTAAEKQTIRQAVAPAPLIQINVNLSGDVATKLLLARGLAGKKTGTEAAPASKAPAQPAQPAQPSIPTPPAPTVTPLSQAKMMENTARAVGGPIAGAVFEGLHRRGLVP